MQSKNTTTSYINLTTQAFELFRNSFAAANQRGLEYLKSVYEISSRPYASSALETISRENFDRANQVMSLTFAELQTSGQKAAEFGEQLAAHGAQIQDSIVTAMRGVADSGISNMNFVKDATSHQIDEIAKRIDDVQNHATAQVSAN